jgi:hypothetical protein
VVATGGSQSQIRRPQEPQKHAKTVAVGCQRLPEEFHGKEGVDGSSPSEGFSKSPANGPIVLSETTKRDASRVRDGYIFGPAGTRGIERHALEQARDTRTRAPISKSSCNQAVSVACVGATLTPSFAGEGVTAARLARLTGRGRCDVECPAVEAELVDVLVDERRQGGAAAMSRPP